MLKQNQIERPLQEECQEKAQQDKDRKMGGMLHRDLVFKGLKMSLLGEVLQLSNLFMGKPFRKGSDNDIGMMPLGIKGRFFRIGDAIFPLDLDDLLRRNHAWLELKDSDGFAKPKAVEVQEEV